MINVAVDGKMLTVNPDLAGQMKQVADIMEKSVKLNFQVGGRPQWKPLEPNIYGRLQAFYPPGDLYMSIKKNSGETWAEVSLGEGLAYARRQMRGGSAEIPIKPRMRGYFWWMYKNTGDVKWRNMAKTTKMSFNHYLNQRNALLFQQEDIDMILDIIKKGIITFTEVGEGARTRMTRASATMGNV